MNDKTDELIRRVIGGGVNKRPCSIHTPAVTYKQPPPSLVRVASYSVSRITTCIITTCMSDGMQTTCRALSLSIRIYTSATAPPQGGANKTPIRRLELELEFGTGIGTGTGIGMGWDGMERDGRTPTRTLNYPSTNLATAYVAFEARVQLPRTASSTPRTPGVKLATLYTRTRARPASWGCRSGGICEPRRRPGARAATSRRHRRRRRRRARAKCLYPFGVVYRVVGVDVRQHRPRVRVARMAARRCRRRGTSSSLGARKWFMTEDKDLCCSS